MSTVSRVTGCPASWHRFANKGLLKEGFDADVLVFDPETIAPGFTYGENIRLCTGIEKVFVDGVLTYDNGALAPQPYGEVFGEDMGLRMPLFDVEVTAQKQNPYSRMNQNELALQFYSAGFFNPQMADQALACLDMMDFDRKQFIMQKIAQNGTMYQQMMQMQQQMMMLAQMVDQARGSNIAEQLMAQFSGGAPVAPIDGGMAAKNVEKTEALGGKEGGGEATNTKKARQRVAESTDPT